MLDFTLSDNLHEYVANLRWNDGANSTACDMVILTCYVDGLLPSTGYNFALSLCLTSAPESVCSVRPAELMEWTAPSGRHAIGHICSI